MTSSSPKNEIGIENHSPNSSPSLFLFSVFFITVILPSILSAQLTGKVTDSINQPLTGVSVYIKNTFVGTVTNQNGEFYLSDLPKKKGEIIFKSLGYKTIKHHYDLESLPHYFEISLKEELISLQEVTLNATEIPANAIIRATIEKRKKYLLQDQTLTANFYSKGIISTNSMPKKILGQEIDVSDQALDSTRSGILYLSETFSKIYKEKGKFKEVITASKVSGDEQGITFNSASDAEFNFYQSTVNLGNELISPISPVAFSFYKFRLLGTFYTDDGHLINQIEVKRKNKTSPTFEGVIYIVEDDWSFYGIALEINRMQSSITILDQFRIKQNFNYDSVSKRWIKSDQVIDFKLGIFGFNFLAQFSGVYTQYDFDPVFEKKTFGKMVYKIEEGANQKDSLFVQSRPIPLTQKELSNYVKKDSIVKAHEAPAYLDSLDREVNRFKWKDFIGKRIQNTQKETSYGFSIPPSAVHFNTVQGYNARLNLYYNRNWEKEKKSLKINSNQVYGFSDEQWYPNIQIDYLMNSVYYPRWSLKLGRSLDQFDGEQPFSLLWNDAYSLLLKENYSKWYQNTKMEINFKSYLKSDFYFSTTLGYFDRNPRSNTSDFSYFNKNKTYQSNMPKNPYYDFQSHNLKKYTISLEFRPQNQYYQYTNQRFYTQKENYPKLNLQFTQALGSSVSRYNFIKLDFSYDQTLSLGLVGETFLKIKTGRFLQKESPAFMDFNHFHGNEIIFGKTTPYLNQFNLLPYYQYSTANDYFLTHWEHRFKKWGVGNWPLIRLLKSEFIAGFHSLAIQGEKPHFEVNIGLDKLGFGKFKILRLDYFWALGKLNLNQGLRVNLAL